PAGRQEKASMDVIYAYSRAQALNDGVLVDVTKMAKEAGVRPPTAATPAGLERYGRGPPGPARQDRGGRPRGLVLVRAGALVQNTDRTSRKFQLYVRNDEGAPKLVTLRWVCGPGDEFEPVLTVLLPEED